MNNAVTTAMQRFDDLSLRERAMIWVSALLMLIAIWYLSLMAPDMKRETRLKADIASVHARMDVLNSGIVDQASEVSGNGRLDNQRRLARIQKRAGDVTRALAAYSAELIDPAQMANVMEDMLGRQHGLTLVRISNLDPQVLVAADTLGQGALYRHGLRIEIEGSYLASLRYLQDLEALRWRFYWSLVDVDAGRWPGTRMVIEVNTLSLDEDWIGV